MQIVNFISQKTILGLNHFFKKASWFDVLNKSDEDTLKYGLKSGEVVLSQFDGYNNFKNKVVLDFGAGFGAKTAYYASMGAKKVYGVDFHKDFSLVEKYSKENSLDIELITLESDGLLPLENESINIVISSAVFEHVVDVDTSLSEIKRVLKPNGLFLNRWHPYGTRHGSHVNGLIGIPFVHLFFSQKNIMSVYQELLNKKTKEVGQTLLYNLSDKEYKTWGDIGLAFNYYNIKQMSSKTDEFCFNILEKKYYLATKEVSWVRLVPDLLKPFFIDYEIIISKKVE